MQRADPWGGPCFLFLPEKKEKTNKQKTQTDKKPLITGYN